MFANRHFSPHESARFGHGWIAAGAPLFGASVGANEISSVASLEADGAPASDGYVPIYRASGGYAHLASIGNDGRYLAWRLAAMWCRQLLTR